MPFSVFVLLLLILFQPFAFAEEASLGEVIVQPPRTAPVAPQYDSSLTAIVIPSKELANQTTSLPEVLGAQAGVQVRRYGGLDDFATVAIRGSTSEQVAVFLDGVLLNPLDGGPINLAAIPTDQIEKIEIYRGAVPARFSTGAMGGAVVIQTKRAEKTRSTQLSGSYGSFNTLETSLSQTQTLTLVGYAAHYHLLRTDGDFSFKDDNGTPQNPADDQTAPRKNNELARHNLLLKLSRPLGPGTIEFQENLHREDRGIPGLGTLTSETAALATTRSLTRMEWSHQALSLAPFFQYQKQQFSDPEGEIGLGNQNSNDDTLAYGLETTSQLMAGSHHHLTFLASYRGEQFLPEDLMAQTSGPTSRRNQAALGVEDELLLWGEKLILNPSVRTEHILNSFAGSGSSTHPVSGKLGLRYNPNSLVTLKTNFARASRVPNFSELFGDRGSLIGNANLVPEKGWNWDAGGSLTSDFFRLETVYFLNHVSDLIQFLQTSQLTARAENLNSARIQGIESTALIPIVEQLEFSGNYTFQWPKDTSQLPGTQDKFLPGRPRHEATGRLSFLPRWGRLSGEWTYMDGNFLDSQNLLRVSNRSLVGANLSWFATKKITTSLDAKNLLDDQVVDVVGYPLPGRSFYGKLEISI